MLQGKKILLGVSGSIAAYKAAECASALTKLGAEVHVLMTKNAAEFIAPLTFETLTKHRVALDTFDRNFEYKVGHISLAKDADALVIAPASADVIAKLANGLADDMLTTTALACTCPKILAPAMNSHMFENPATQANLTRLRNYEWEILEPDSGLLACGDIGKGRMPETERIVETVVHTAHHEKDMKGLRVLVTAGPTQEALDPVRYLTNHSTGRMGYAVAEMAACRGAEVILISGATELPRLQYVETVDVRSAEDMFNAVASVSTSQDIIIKAAAVADFRPAVVSDSKIKKDAGSPYMSLRMEKTNDILLWLGLHRSLNQTICGFSMETENLVENSRAKLQKKHVDMIAANSLRTEGAGFGTSTNVLTLITRDREVELPKMGKKEAADRILDEIMKMRKAREAKGEETERVY
jgi:phosphopantothenoylcysteine decarboxylase/phosphopantothenate--cysteine ligase